MKNNISDGVVHKVPADLKEALTSDSRALTVWDNLTPLARNEWICWVTSVKKEETRKDLDRNGRSATRRAVAERRDRRPRRSAARDAQLWVLRAEA